MSSPPLLAATDLRIDVAGAVAIERATFECGGHSVVILGDADAIVASVLGQGRVRSGTLRLCGWNVHAREHWNARGRLGVAPLDPPLPLESTVSEYLVAAGRLAGLAHRDARRAAMRTLNDLGLEQLEKRPIKECHVAERRAAVLAQALLTSPAVLVAPGPLARLSSVDADFVLGVLDRARTGRTWISTIEAVRPATAEHALATWADEVLVFSSGRLVRHGNLSVLEQGVTGYTLVVRGEVGAFRQALAERNVQVSGGPERFWVELGRDLSLLQLLALSLQVGAPIIELIPRLLTEPGPVVKVDP